MTNIIKFKVGKTCSGETISYTNSFEEIGEFVHEHYKDFFPDDCFDAICVFYYLISRALKNKRDNFKEVMLFDGHSNLIMTLFEDETEFDRIKEKLGIVTSFDMCRFGSKLVSQEFKMF